MAVEKIEIKEYKWQARDDGGKLIANAKYRTGDSLHINIFQENGIDWYDSMYLWKRQIKAFAEMFPKIVQDIEEDERAI